MLDLLITADMNIVIDDTDVIKVTADGGQVLVVTFPSLSTAINIWRRHGSVLSPVVPFVTSGLTISTLTIDVMVKETRIARIGAGVPLTIIGRIVGIARLQVFYSKLIGSLMK